MIWPPNIHSIHSSLKIGIIYPRKISSNLRSLSFSLFPSPSALSIFSLSLSSANHNATRSSSKIGIIYMRKISSNLRFSSPLSFSLFYFLSLSRFSPSYFVLQGIAKNSTIYAYKNYVDVIISEAMVCVIIIILFIFITNFPFLYSFLLYSFPLFSFPFSIY